MRRPGLSAEHAGATEAIASTGGQLMPPVMGVAAFVMAELLSVPYQQVALAGVIPALAFYIALYFSADLHARKTGLGTLTRDDVRAVPPLLPRLHLLLPPIVADRHATDWTLRHNWQRPMPRCRAFHSPSCGEKISRASTNFSKMISDLGRQMAEIAVPIAAIGIIIAIAIQSNIALKFAAGVIAAGGGTIFGSLLLVVLGCIIMGMGLPTVAAYIIGAILYVPALRDLGCAAHGRAFLRHVLLRALDGDAAGRAGILCGCRARRRKPDEDRADRFPHELCRFLVPFAFVMDPGLLFQTSLPQSLIASAGLLFSTAIWAIGLVGYCARALAWGDRVLLMIFGISRSSRRPAPAAGDLGDRHRDRFPGRELALAAIFLRRNRSGQPSTTGRADSGEP